MTDVFAIIFQIQERKCSEHRHPVHALMREIEAEYSGNSDELKTEINRLFRMKMIRYGHTINQIYFTINEANEI